MNAPILHKLLHSRLLKEESEMMSQSRLMYIIKMNIRIKHPKMISRMIIKELVDFNFVKKVNNKAGYRILPMKTPNWPF